MRTGESQNTFNICFDNFPFGVADAPQNPAPFDEEAVSEADWGREIL